MIYEYDIIKNKNIRPAPKEVYDQFTPIIHKSNLKATALMRREGVPHSMTLDALLNDEPRPYNLRPRKARR